MVLCGQQSSAVCCVHAVAHNKPKPARCRMRLRAADNRKRTPPPNNPIQSSVALFQVLQQKSRVFPDLATNVERVRRLAEIQAGGQQ